MKVWVYLQIFIIVLLGILFLAPDKSHAESNNQGIFINEIMWRGSSVSTADEWLELYNNSDQVVNLKNWSVCNKVKDQDCENPMVIISSGQIAPGGYFLISNNSKDHLFTKDGAKVESILNKDPDIIDPTLSLSNKDFKIALLNANDEREIVDVAGNSKEPFYGENEGQIASMQRVDFSKTGDLKES